MEKLKEIAVSFAVDQLLPHVTKVVNTIKDVPKDVADMKAKLDGVQAIIHAADRMAEAEEDYTERDGIKRKMKQMIETSFQMEDIMDEYTIREEKQQQHGDDPGCAALPCKTVDFAKAMNSRLQFSYTNEVIKSEFRGIKERNKAEDGSQNQSSIEQGPSSSIVNQNATLLNLREAPLYIDEADVVGFDVPRKKLIDWLVKGRVKLTVIAVIGIGGQGKTTLAKNVFDNKKVVGHFIFHVWITVSQSYTVERLLRDLLQKLCKETKESPPENVAAMDQRSLTDEVRKHLRNKRYVVVFDDVWNPNFWDEMEFALIDNKTGSRIFVTTRNKDVALRCKRSVSVQEHELQPLTLDMSLALFNRKVFGSDLDGRCPNNLKKISIEIVEKCKGLPLAIVAIGGLLSRKEKDALEWQRFSQNLSLELGKNPHLTAVTKILAFSYHDLPYRLKQCFLYLGIFPEDYEVNRARLIRQWIAEGFVQYAEMKTLEEAANQYLTELINRSLVQVSSITCDGKTKSCGVHDLVRDMILKKVVDLSFCHFANEHGNQSGTRMIRRLTIASSSNNWSGSAESSNIRSLHVFQNKLSEPFVMNIPTKYKLLKVLDFEGATLYNCVPEYLEDFFLLRYLSFRNTDIRYLPRSIGVLCNLETLDVRKTRVREMPREINKLKKLRHLLAYWYSLFEREGIRMEDDIGDLTSLETLSEVDMDKRGGELIKELERLTHLRVLGLTYVRQEYGRALCSLINKMKHLEKLNVAATGHDSRVVIDLHFHVSAPVLRKLHLDGKLDTLPIWVAQLQNIVKLSLSDSKLTHDPLALLKDLPNLLCLRILDEAYEGKCLHFPDGGFENLKLLVLKNLRNLNSILIDRGTLPHLRKLVLDSIPNLNEVPFGVYNLPMLEVVHCIHMPFEFQQSIDCNRGKHQWIIQNLQW